MITSNSWKSFPFNLKICPDCIPLGILSPTFRVKSVYQFCHQALQEEMKYAILKLNFHHPYKI